MLKKLRKLNATKEMMSKANADSMRRGSGRWGSTINTYETGMYMRCQQLKGIVKIAFFLTEYMKLGAATPVYELFINPEVGEFITWDNLKQKWSNAKLDMLDWPEYVYESKKWINQEGNNTIKKRLGVKNGGYRGILDYQLKVREDELKQKHRRETDPWDLDMEQIPSLPKDWSRWVDKVAITENFIFYEYTRKGATQGYCTWCEKQVPITKAKHNTVGKCKCCGHDIVFKSVGKAGHFRTNRESGYLIQRCENGFVVRQFEVNRHYRKGEYENPDKHYFEVRRTIFTPDLYARVYYFGLYKQYKTRWIKSNPSSWAQPGKVYGRTIPTLDNNELKRTGLSNMIKTLNKLDPEIYLLALKKDPSIEQIAKAGLTELALELTGQSYWRRNHPEINEKGELSKRLGIDSQRLKRLREMNGGITFLDWMQYEKKHNKSIPSDVIKWFESHGIEPKDIKFVSDRMSEIQICNYLKKQMKDYQKESIRKIISDWKDYLSMAKRVQMNVYDSIVYKAKNLKKRHDELVSYINNNEAEVLEMEMMSKYPNVNTICTELKEKYEYSDDKYAVVVPSGIKEIIEEGNALHHCVGTSERYFDRINAKEAYILFLRKAEEVEKPYYTLEIEPNGTIRQKRTEYDRQKKDIEDASKFLKKWQQEVQKRLTEEDLKLSENSKELRINGLEELRKNNVIIHTGDLAGSLLADVLESDLMEVDSNRRCG